jgi:hypothetical protein
MAGGGTGEVEPWVGVGEETLELTADGAHAHATVNKVTVAIAHRTLSSFINSSTLRIAGRFPPPANV